MADAASEGYGVGQLYLSRLGDRNILAAMSGAIKIWLAFVIVSITTPVVYKTAYAIPGFLVILGLLAVCATALAVMALRTSGVHVWSVIAALVGLVIGQWWLIESALVLASMIRPGFAT
jgi:hypothetical protein